MSRIRLSVARTEHSSVIHTTKNLALNLRRPAPPYAVQKLTWRTPAESLSPILHKTHIVEKDLAMSIFDKSSLREGEFRLQRGIGQRVPTARKRRQMSKEQKGGYIFNCSLVDPVS